MDQHFHHQVAPLTLHAGRSELASEPPFVLAVGAFHMRPAAVAFLGEPPPQLVSSRALWPRRSWSADLRRDDAADSECGRELMVGFAVVAGVGQNFRNRSLRGGASNQTLERRAVGPRADRYLRRQVDVAARVADSRQLRKGLLAVPALGREVAADAAGLVAGGIDGSRQAGLQQLASAGDANRSVEKSCEAPFSRKRSWAYLRVEKLGMRFRPRTLTSSGQSLSMAMTPR